MGECLYCYRRPGVHRDPALRFSVLAEICCRCYVEGGGKPDLMCSGCAAELHRLSVLPGPSPNTYMSQQDADEYLLNLLQKRQKAQMAQGDMSRVQERERCIKRLKEIVETEYTIGDIDKLEDDMHDLALAMLDILCDGSIAKGAHVMDQHRMQCVLCGMSAREIKFYKTDECPEAK